MPQMQQIVYGQIRQLAFIRIDPVQRFLTHAIPDQHRHDIVAPHLQHGFRAQRDLANGEDDAIDALLNQLLDELRDRWSWLLYRRIDGDGMYPVIVGRADNARAKARVEVPGGMLGDMPDSARVAGNQAFHQAVGPVVIFFRQRQDTRAHLRTDSRLVLQREPDRGVRCSG